MKKLVIVALLMVLPFGLSAQGPGMHSGERQGPAKGFLEGLDLTPEQSAKLKELKSGRGEMRENMQELRQEREKLMQMVRDKKVSDQQIRVAAKALADKRANLERDRVEHLLELRKVLTPQQLDKVIERIKDKVQERMQGSESGRKGLRMHDQSAGQ